MFTLNKNANAERIRLGIKNLSTLTTTGIRRAFYDIGKDLVKDAKDLINKQPKSGRVYRKYTGVQGPLRSSQNYTASAAGEAPAVVTGVLRKSINFQVSGSIQMAFGIDLSRGGVLPNKGQEATYGKYLEYGNLISMSGKGSKNIEPRPFISASYQKNKRKVMQKFVEAINKEIGK